MPKLEAIAAVTSRPIKAKGCLLLESAKIIIEFVINADATNTKIRFLKLVLYLIRFASSLSCSSWMSVQIKNKFIA